MAKKLPSLLSAALTGQRTAIYIANNANCPRICCLFCLQRLRATGNCYLGNSVYNAYWPRNHYLYCLQRFSTGQGIAVSIVYSVYWPKSFYLYCLQRFSTGLTALLHFTGLCRATTAATQWVVTYERRCAVNEEILLQFSRQVVTCTYNFRSLSQLVCKTYGQCAKCLITWSRGNS